MMIKHGDNDVTTVRTNDQYIKIITDKKNQTSDAVLSIITNDIDAASNINGNSHFLFILALPRFVSKDICMKANEVYKSFMK